MSESNLGILLHEKYNCSTEKTYYTFMLKEAMGDSVKETIGITQTMQLQDPGMTAVELAQNSGQSLAQVRSTYQGMKNDPEIRGIVNSPYYKYRIMWTWAADILNDLTKDKEYADRLVRGESIMSRVLEIHATRGTCEYRCEMCCWSDRKTPQLRTNEIVNYPLGLRKWRELLVDSYTLGARTVLFSGGGEPLLNQDLFELVDFTEDIGFEAHLFTNGFGLKTLSDHQWDQLLKLKKIRISVHSPTAETYNKIVGISSKRKALDRVTQSIGELLRRRDEKHAPTSVGIGFVIQPQNFAQIAEIAEYSAELGVDFLNIRRDDVAITKLAPEQAELMVVQLNLVRKRILNGSYRSTLVDMSDKLTAIANGEEFRLRKVTECFSRLLRPGISPKGIVYHCELKAMPRFTNQKYSLGDTKHSSLKEIAAEIPNKKIPANCKACLPSGKAGNVIYSKLLSDYNSGIKLADQPFGK